MAGFENRCGRFCVSLATGLVLSSQSSDYRAMNDAVKKQQADWNLAVTGRNGAPLARKKWVTPRVIAGVFEDAELNAGVGADGNGGLS